MTITRHKVTLYGKKECCLCDEAAEVMQKVSLSVPFDFEKIDISDNQELFNEFGLKIPVIFVDGVQAFKFRVNEARFRAMLLAEKV